MVLPSDWLLPGNVPTRHQRWLAVLAGPRDANGDYFDGSNTYTLSVPLPAPAKQFFSVPVYDAQTRSQVQTPQGKAVLSSLFDHHDASGDSVELYFGPESPDDSERRWVQTTPDRGWFVYFRIYGPETPAFDGTWQLPDFERA